MGNPVPGKNMVTGEDLGEESKANLQTFYEQTGGMAASVGSTGEDEYAQAREMVLKAKEQAQAALEQASSVIGNHLVSLRGVGSASQYAQQAMDSLRSVSERLAGEGEEEGDGIKVFPGGVYVAHLARRLGAMKRDRAKSKSADDEINIYTDHMQALKTALGALGLYSERNPGGMPIDIKAAKKIWFGDEKIDGMKEAEWRSIIETGDSTIDPKRIRKFVNYDGSTTWEMLNEDKTVMSRFTLGEHKGVKVFTQGGYGKFAEVLKEAQAKFGADEGKEFSSMRGRLLGGVNG